MCPVAAHSVKHLGDFATQPHGTCDETFASYPPSHADTLCGEVRVSKELLQQASGAAVTSWRSPYLYVHPDQFDVLWQNGFNVDSSFGVGDLKFNLPVSGARTGVQQSIFRGRPLHTFPIALEDGFETVLADGG